MTVLTWPIAATLIDPPGAGKASTITQYTSNTCVGHRLRVRRMSRGISEGELCYKLGIDRCDLKAYENGAKRVRANLLLRIAEFLNVRPDHFFQGYTADELSACLESPHCGPRAASRLD
jgi:transcriptional regulator with XRE-family HTH domain